MRETAETAAIPPDVRAYRGRFAPSPTGDLHLGSLVAALGSWLFARRARGQWHVRIEDLDPPREVAGAAARQLAALTAFGLRPDGPVVYQSSRAPAYALALEALLDTGHAFECHCSRADLAPMRGVHRGCIPGRRRRDPAIRMRVPEGSVVVFEDGLQGRVTQDVADAVGDFVLRRADGLWAYQLAVVVDDTALGVTDIVRGADLLDSTARQILLQRALGCPTPRYAHLPLVRDAGGNKLSKSEGAGAVDAMAPLPELERAWRFLAQAPLGERVASVDEWLERALEHFEPSAFGRSDEPATATNDLHS